MKIQFLGSCKKSGYAGETACATCLTVDTLLRLLTAAVLVFSQIRCFWRSSRITTGLRARAAGSRIAPAQTQTPPAPAKPGADAAKPQGATTGPAPTIAPSPAGTLTLQNASMTEVIDYLARQLKINYILDPRVRGGVTINTYGETKTIDNRTLLDTILRINGAAMIQVGDIYRIVPLADVQRLPLRSGDQREADSGR